MLEKRIKELHKEAHSVAFSWYLRKGCDHPRLKEIMDATASVEAFIAYSLKYSPDQPRVPAGHPDGGQWTREGGDGATPSAVSAPKPTNGHEKPSSALAALPKISVPGLDGKHVNKVNIFIGGAGDQSDSHIVENSSSRSREVHGDNYYANNEQKDEINALIAALPKDQKINLIGHSWGARRAAIAAVDNPGRVNILITIDPVGYSHPAYDAIRNSVHMWINVNLTGNPNSWRTTVGNVLAGVGSAWNNKPDGHAHVHLRIPLDHEEFSGAMQYTSPSREISLIQTLNSNQK